MSPSPGDVTQAPEARSTGGLAGVFKLAGSKLTKSPPPPAQPQPLLASLNPTPNLSDLSSGDFLGLSLELTDPFERLKDGSSLAERAAAADAIRQALVDYPQTPIVDIWDAAKGLIEPSNPAFARVAGWQLLAACVKTTSATDLERNEYFQVLTARANPEDFRLQLAALNELTRDGRNLSGFEYDVIPLLTTWLNECYQAVRTARRNAAQASRNAAKGTPKGKAPAIPEDQNFSQLFTFLLAVLKFNFKVAGDNAVAGLIDSLLNICMNTSVEEDLRACISVINAIVTFGTIRAEKLKDCVLLLSSICSLVDALQKEAWHALANLFKSHHGPSAVRILIDVLRSMPPNTPKEKGKDVHRDVKSALYVLQRLVSKNAEKGYPAVPLALLVDALANAAKISSSRVSASVLKLITSLFPGDDGKLNVLLVDEDWSAALDVAAECGQQVSGLPTSDIEGSMRSTSSGGKRDEVIGPELNALITRIEALLKIQGPDFVHKQECINFLTKVQHVLPNEAAALVLDYLKEYRCCCPSDIEWESNLQIVMEGFFLNRRRQSNIRLRALEIIVEVYDMLVLVEIDDETKHIPELIKQVLSCIPEENDTVVLQEAVNFMVSVADSAEMTAFMNIAENMRKVLANDRLKPPISASPVQTPTSGNPSDRTGYFASQSPSNVITRGYVQMFMRAMDSDVEKAAAAYTALVHIARSNLCETDARLTAMKMLFRLRADWSSRVFLTTFTESEGLAGYLCRTEASLARKVAEEAAQSSRLSRTEHSVSSRTTRGISFTQGSSQERVLPSRSTTSHSKPSATKYLQLWALPDPDALPETPATAASPLLFSQVSQEVDLEHMKDGGGKGSLDLASWLDALLSLFHQGCDWEVYSFVLVHLPSQLSNHGIFQGAIAQIKELRKVICELIRMNSFQDAPNTSGVRRSDVSICLFNTLIMLLSYHDYFLKSEEDEIVRTFMHGISDRTAKTCIHALSICCHELPLSVSKTLVTILQRMSQIITQPFVAMHILEFLASLSRLHSLYSNFREEEYRIVFGICSRYLQNVRDKKRSVRASHLSEGSAPSVVISNYADAPGNASDDLPQYVYALAYHVITFWFLAVKLPDRPGHIGSIAKSLFTDVDGSMNNEEQAQITMDFLQRVTYADVPDSAEDPSFTEARYGEILQKKWIIGNSIVTIKQAKDSGWAQVTRRQPSGTSAFTIRETFMTPLPHHTQDTSEHAGRDGHFVSSSTILPSHLLIQLLSSIPQSYDAALRPIPLPDDEQVGRAIRAFDRSSTVDGHKVGVIYIGEGQTKEAEILANVAGSRDYVRFLEGLGTLTKLKGAKFNTQGLDREYDTDGPYTFCWRDRVTEIVFHVTTQMPTNLERDAQCIGKKRHIGNDFVNIIWNDSGLPFNFDTFPSDFNYVNIVITPESRASFVGSREKAARAKMERENKGELAGSGVGGEDDADDVSSFSPFHKVRVMSKVGFPEISAAADTKMISLKALPGFVRLLALNASVFSLVWANREGGEHVSSWRNRLREINRLRDRYGPNAANTPSPPQSLGGPAGSSSVSVNPNPLSGGAGQQSQNQAQQQQLPLPQRDPLQNQQQHLAQPQPGTQQQQGAQDNGGSTSRPGSSVRDSFTSLRRASVATFFTNTSEQTSHRSSVLSTATTDTEIMPSNGTDSVVDAIDFSKWA